MDEFGGFRTRVFTADGAGPPVVLLHGFSDRAESWFPVMEFLSARGQRSIAVDLPGAGRADTLGPGDVLPQFDRFVSRLVEHYAEDGVGPILVGNSVGASAALRAGQRDSSAIRGLVLIAPAGIRYARWVHTLRRLRPLHGVLLTPIVPMPVFRWLSARTFAHLARGDGRLLPGAALNHAAQFQRRPDVRRVLGPGVQMIAELPEDGRPAMPAVPTLVLWGRQDRMTPVRGAGILRSLAPDAQVEVLDGLGHCPQIERPDVIGARILDFVAEVVDATSPAVRLARTDRPGISAAP